MLPAKMSHYKRIEQKLGNQQSPIASEALIKKARVTVTSQKGSLLDSCSSNAVTKPNSPRTRGNLGNDSGSLAESDTEPPGEKSSHTPMWGLGFSL